MISRAMLDPVTCASRLWISGGSSVSCLLRRDDMLQERMAPMFMGSNLNSVWNIVCRGEKER